MLPDNCLSTEYTALIGSSNQTDIIGARAKTLDLVLIDYENGGIDIGDTSEGLDYQEWVGTYANQKITLTGANGNTYNIITIDSSEILSDFSFSFDQSGSPAIVYVVNDVVYFRYYDSLLEDYTIVEQQASMRSPKLFMDDKRSLNSSNSDIILAYVNSDDDTLCYRQQRDRYLTERVLKTDLTSWFIEGSEGDIRLCHFGMGSNLRLQFIIKRETECL